MSAGMRHTSSPVSAGGGGGGGAVDAVTAGTGITVSPTTGTVVVSADFGSGAGKVAQATVAAFATILGLTSIGATGVVHAKAAVTPTYAQTDEDGVATNGDDFKILAQNAADGVGGSVQVLGGTGVTTNGGVKLGDRSGSAFASTGVVRLQRRASLVGRNDGNTQDVPWLSQSSADVLTVGGANNAGLRYDAATGNTHELQVGGVVKLTVASAALTSASVVIAPSLQLTSSSGPTITTGAGAPASTPANGSVYFRSDGTSSTTAYVRAAGAWAALSTGGGGSTITWADDLATSADAHQYVSAITGATNKTILRATSRALEWEAATTTPSLGIADVATASATGATFSLLGQNATGGTTANGGFIAVLVGTGSGGGVSGALQLGDRSGSAFASTGVVRFQKLVSMRARNNGDTGNLNIVSLDTSDIITHGGTLNSGIVLGVATAASIKLQVNAVDQVSVSSTSIDLTPATIGWLTTATAPKLYQADNSTNSATAQPLLIQAQNATGTAATGAILDLRSGTGTTAAGILTLRNGATIITTVQVGTSSVAGLLVNSGTANSLAAEFQTNATTRWQIGNDATGAFIRNASAAVSATGLFRTTKVQTIVAARNNGNSADICCVATDASDIIYLGVSAGAGSRAAYAVIDPANYLEVRSNGSQVAQFSTAFNLNVNLTFSKTATDVVMVQSAQVGDVATRLFQIFAQNASGSSTGTNRNGGRFDLGGGDRKDTNGRRRGVALNVAASYAPIVSACDVQAEITAASRVVALFFFADVTSTNMPTGTGDGVLAWKAAATAPTQNPGTGVSALYVDAANDNLKARGSGGTVTTLAAA